MSAETSKAAERFLNELGVKIIFNKRVEAFSYKDLGSMATIGRNRAVVDLKRSKFQGFFAWAIWLTVHLFSLIGVKNRIFVFINWIWNYSTYDQSLRLIIKPKVKANTEELSIKSESS